MASEPKPRILKVSWLRYLVRIWRLARAVRKSGFKPDHIVAISRGGLVAGVILSHLLRDKDSGDVPLSVIGAVGYSEDMKRNEEIVFERHMFYPTGGVAKNVLVVDDLDDSGRTLAFVVEHLRRKFPGITVIRFAVVFHKISSKVMPDYIGQEIGVDRKTGLVPWIRKPEESKRLHLVGTWLARMK